jgi:aminoglycoside phosphotransferase (APT) family kinase protein
MTADSILVHSGSPPGLDVGALADFLSAASPGLIRNPLDAVLITGGRSNLTYGIRDADGRELIVRRPPLGHVLATAHDMAREYRVITALEGTDVPVPHAHLLCPDPSVIGAPFFVMDKVPGVALRQRAELELLGAERVRRICHRMISTLARLHAIDPGQAGLQDFGRTKGYLRRQVNRWRRQLDQSHSRDLPGLDELYQRLAGSIPEESRPAIVHGDYRRPDHRGARLGDVDAGRPAGRHRGAGRVRAGGDAEPVRRTGQRGLGGRIPVARRAYRGVRPAGGLPRQ